MAQTAQYDPTAQTPYQAPELPQVQAPQPSPLQPPRSPDQPAPATKAGGIASIADNMMRGFMQGRARAQAQRAQKQENTTKALQSSYNLAAQNLQQLVQSHNLTQDQVSTIMKGGVPEGVDQGTIEALKNANQAVQGSWTAWTTWLGQHVEQEPGTGKGGKKGKDKGDKLPFLQRLAQGISGKDPAEVSKAIYDFYVKNGPPVYGSIASATANAKQKADAIKLEGAQTANALTKEEAQATYDKYAGMSEEQLSKLDPAEKEKFENAKSIITGITTKGNWETIEYAGPNGEKRSFTHDKFTDEWRDENRNSVAGPPSGWTKVASRASTHPIMRFEMENGKMVSYQIDPSTNQPIPSTRDDKAVPPAGYADKIRHGESFQTDAAGNLVKVETTSTTSPVLPGHGGTVSAPKSGGASPSGGGAPKAPKEATAPEEGPKYPPGVHPTGIYKGSQEYKDLVKEVDKANIAANGTVSQLGFAEKAAPKAKAGDGSAMVAVVAAYVKGVIGGAGTGVRVTQTEWNQAVNTAPLLTRIGAHFTDSGVYGVDVKSIAPEQIDSMLVQLKAKAKTAKSDLVRVKDQLKQQEAEDKGTPQKTETFNWDAHPVVK